MLQFVIKSTWNWFIINLKVKTFYEIVACKKRPGSKRNKLEQTKRKKTISNKRRKANLPSSWVPNNPDKHSIVLFSLKIDTSFALWHYAEKWNMSSEIIEQLDIIDFMGKYFLMHKVAFLSMTQSFLYQRQSWMDSRPNNW